MYVFLPIISYQTPSCFKCQQAHLMAITYVGIETPPDIHCRTWAKLFYLFKSQLFFLCEMGIIHYILQRFKDIIHVIHLPSGGALSKYFIVFETLFWTEYYLSIVVSLTNSKESLCNCFTDFCNAKLRFGICLKCPLKTPVIEHCEVI